MEDQTQQDQTQAPALSAEGSEPKQDVLTQDPTGTDATLTAPNDQPAYTGPGTDPGAPAVDPTTAPAAADNSTREEQAAEDATVAQLVAAQMARARNALAHMEEAAAREVHAALDEIKGLLGIE